MAAASIVVLGSSCGGGGEPSPLDEACAIIERFDELAINENRTEAENAEFDVVYEQLLDIGESDGVSSDEINSECPSPTYPEPASSG